MRLILRRRFPVTHYVLVDAARRASPERLIVRARRCAGAIALRATGHAEQFTLIHNGAGLARRAAPHVHIVCARSRFEKALVYFLIGWKNVFADLAR